jgi:hypothetical protein
MPRPWVRTVGRAAAQSPAKTRPPPAACRRLFEACAGAAHPGLWPRPRPARWRPAPCRGRVLVRLHGGAPHFEGLALNHGRGPGCRLKCPDAPLQPGCRRQPIQRGLGLVNFGGVAHAFCGLGRARQSAAPQALQGLNHQRSTQLGQLVVQAARVVLGADGQSLHQQHVAGVQARIHLHDGHAGVRVARLDGAVYGRRPPPARQQRGVDVDAAQAGQGQRPGRQDQAVGGHHHGVGLHGPQGVLCGSGVFRVFAVEFEAARLRHGNAVVQRKLLDGRGLQLHAPAGRAVGLAHHQGDLHACAVQAGEGDLGKFGGAGKHNAHKNYLIKLIQMACWPAQRTSINRSPRPIKTSPASRSSHSPACGRWFSQPPTVPAK